MEPRVTRALACCPGDTTTGTNSPDSRRWAGHAHAPAAHARGFGRCRSPDLVDSEDKSYAPRSFPARARDLVLVFRWAYTPSMNLLPAVRNLGRAPAPARCPRRSYLRLCHRRYALYLHHEGPCCIPEYAARAGEHGQAFFACVRAGSMTRAGNTRYVRLLGAAARAPSGRCASA